MKPLSDISTSWRQIYQDLVSSPSPNATGLDPKVMGNALDTMMKQLGYEKYGVISTDLGVVIVVNMIEAVEDSIVGHFADFLFLNPTPEDQERMSKGETTEEENEYINAMNTWNTQHFAHAPMHAIQPLLLSLIR
jgi:demethoxyubiquinone hydroxylase (CLK1/Coq7/Cat5 family)